MCEVLFIRYIPISPVRLEYVEWCMSQRTQFLLYRCVFADTYTGQRIYFSSKNALKITKTFCEYIPRHVCDDRVTAPRLDIHTDAILYVGICCSQQGRKNYTNFVGKFYFRTVNTALSVSKQPILQHTPVNVSTRQVLISINYSVPFFSPSVSAAQRGLWPPRHKSFLITPNNATQSVELLLDE
jgi:hypothetical protein